MLVCCAWFLEWSFVRIPWSSTVGPVNRTSSLRTVGYSVSLRAGRNSDIKVKTASFGSHYKPRTIPTSFCSLTIIVSDRMGFSIRIRTTLEFEWQLLVSKPCIILLVHPWPPALRCWNSQGSHRRNSSRCLGKVDLMMFFCFFFFTIRWTTNAIWEYPSSDPSWYTLDSFLGTRKRGLKICILTSLNVSWKPVVHHVDSHDFSVPWLSFHFSTQSGYRTKHHRS